MPDKRTPLTTAEKLRRDIRTLQESVRLGIIDRSKGVPEATEQLKHCFDELKKLAKKLEQELKDEQ